MIYRGAGFLAVVCFGFSPISFPLSPVRKLSLLLSLPVCRRSSLLTGEEGGGGGGGAKSYDGERKPGPLYIIQYSLGLLE
jgi:hypothetical protein